MNNLSLCAHARLTFGRESRNVEALRSLYERLELRLWGLLPTRFRRRLTTYGIAELIARHPLEGQEASGITVAELLELDSLEADRRQQPPPPAPSGGSRFDKPPPRAEDRPERGAARRELVTSTR